MEFWTNNPQYCSDSADGSLFFVALICENIADVAFEAPNDPLKRVDRDILFANFESLQGRIGNAKLASKFGEGGIPPLISQKCS